ncbi:hypothetical protein [Nocardioides sp. 1609]|uniref:hypothetical protein n=1 Tax=Nocardioides sp. 1609 TaxID=2508327 RepID=UPI00106FAAEF|nr:hypothetical protein [Nocardioides sp. 1609]
MAVQRWDLVTPEARHRVEADTGGWRKHLCWWVDDELVADVRTADDKVELKPDDADRADTLGLVTLRFTSLGRPRRATWHPPGRAGEAALGLGGTDLEPEPGSPAATYEERVRLHPNRYAAQRTLVAVAGIVLPILLTLLAVRFAVRIPWPDLPSVPWPDLPSLPWPDLPSVPWPDWSLPGWLGWLLDKAKYVWPVVLAYVLARGEIRRRRVQDEKRGLAARPDGPEDGAGREGGRRDEEGRDEDEPRDRP